MRGDGDTAVILTVLHFHSYILRDFRSSIYLVHLQKHDDGAAMAPSKGEGRIQL